MGTRGGETFTTYDAKPGFRWVDPDRPLTLEYRTSLDRGHARGANLRRLACALFLESRLGELRFVPLHRHPRDLAGAVALDA